jgi:integrase
MARTPEPWRRKGVGGAWYAQIRGVKVWLAPATATKTEATAALHRELAAQQTTGKPARAPTETVRDLINRFLAHVEGAVGRDELAKVTEEGYRRYLYPAAQRLGHLPASGLKPHHVQEWVNLDPPNWGPTSRHNAVTAIKRMYNWARRAGHVDANPIADLERPTPERREEILTAEQTRRVLDAIRDRPFRDLIEALRQTGCRPGELYALTAAGVDLEAQVWRVRNKTRRKTGEKVRTVYLNDAMVEMSRRLVEAHPSGPIFRNLKGTPWTRHTVAHRMERLAERLDLGPEAVAYSLRHLYITDALERGIPPATVAELVGHRDVTMIMRIYNQINKRTDHLRDAARAIRPGD